MKVLRVLTCPTCHASFELEAGDVAKRAGYRYEAKCPVCPNVLTVQSRTYAAMFPEQFHALPEPVALPSPKRDDGLAVKVRLAKEAYEARQGAKTEAAAAKTLGITVAELRERISHLPNEMVSAEAK